MKCFMSTTLSTVLPTFLFDGRSPAQRLSINFHNPLQLQNISHTKLLGQSLQDKIQTHWRLFRTFSTTAHLDNLQINVVKHSCFSFYISIIFVSFCHLFSSYFLSHAVFISVVYSSFVLSFPFFKLKRQEVCCISLWLLLHPNTSVIFPLSGFMMLCR